MMTGSEILTHLVTALASGGPTLGLLLGERSKRKTAEKQAETATSQAVLATTEAFRATLEQSKSMAHEALDMARKAKATADACESERDELRDRCDDLLKRCDSLQNSLTQEGRRVAALRSELDTLQASIADMKPDTTHRGVVD